MKMNINIKPKQCILHAWNIKEMQEPKFSQGNVQKRKVRKDHERGIIMSITTKHHELVHNEFILWC